MKLLVTLASLAQCNIKRHLWSGLPLTSTNVIHKHFPPDFCYQSFPSSSNCTSISDHSVFCTTGMSAFTNLQFVRYRKKKSKASSVEHSGDESDESEDEGSELLEKGSVKVTSPSMRVDAVLKASTGFSRPKIEQAFYDGCIKVNGVKCAKKSEEVHLDDEIEMVLHPSPSNPQSCLLIRVFIQQVRITSQRGIQLTVKKDKIENYQSDQEM